MQTGWRPASIDYMTAKRVFPFRFFLAPWRSASAFTGIPGDATANPGSSPSRTERKAKRKPAQQHEAERVVSSRNALLVDCLRSSHDRCPIWPCGSSAMSLGLRNVTNAFHMVSGLSYCIPQWRSGAIPKPGGLVTLRSRKEEGARDKNTRPKESAPSLWTGGPNKYQRLHLSKLFPSLFPKRDHRCYVMQPKLGPGN